MRLKKVFLLGFALFIGFALPGSALADGVIFHVDPNKDKVVYSTEKNQLAYIEHSNGMEKLLLMIETKEELTNQVVWVVPIPASSDKVKNEVLTDLPAFGGREIVGVAKDNLLDAKKLVGYTQVYPAIFDMMRGNLVGDSGNFEGRGYDLSTDSKTFETSEETTDVSVSSHIEENGIVSEVLSAKTTAGLTEYLKSKGLDLGNRTFTALSPYLGKDYSIVASWLSPTNYTATEEDFMTALSNVSRGSLNYSKLGLSLAKIFATDSNYQKYDKYNKSNFAYKDEYLWYYYLIQNPTLVSPVFAKVNQDAEVSKEIVRENVLYEGGGSDIGKGISVSFPTEKAFFPLIPTSAYGDEIVPAEIRIIGFYKPETFSGIAKNTKTQYLHQDNFYSGKSGFAADQDGRIDYTKIAIDSAASAYTQDLWLVPGAPAKVYFAKLFFWKSGNELLLLIAYLVAVLMISFVVGIASGAIVFHKDKPKGRALCSFGFLGLLNGISIIGLIIGTFFWKTKRLATEDAELITSLKSRGHSVYFMQAFDLRKLLFVPVFSAMFMLVTFVIYYLLKLIMM
jgi:hypothetical protein